MEDGGPAIEVGLHRLRKESLPFRVERNTFSTHGVRLVNTERTLDESGGIHAGAEAHVALGIHASRTVDDARTFLNPNIVWHARRVSASHMSLPDNRIHDRRARMGRPPVSQFTLMFETFAQTLARAMPVPARAHIPGRSQRPLWRLINTHVRAARPQEDHTTVRTTGIDETACRRDRDYITPINDMKDPQLLFVTPGRDASTINTVAKTSHVPGSIPNSLETVCMNMSAIYLASMSRAFAQAAITFHRFHLIQMTDAALEEVRHEPSRMFLRAVRARRLKELLRGTDRNIDAAKQAAVALGCGINWARRCWPGPMKKMTARPCSPGYVAT